MQKFWSIIWLHIEYVLFSEKLYLILLQNTMIFARIITAFLVSGMRGIIKHLIHYHLF